jgi:hypothetical protein
MSGGELERLARQYRESIGRARAGGWHALKEFRAAGAAIREMKAILPRGDFGPEIEERCGCTRQWAARLMKLDREWDDVVAGFGWTREAKPELDCSSYSVDGALRVAKLYRARKDGYEPQVRRRSSTRSSKILDDLAAARERLAALELEASGIRKQLADAEKELKAAKLRCVAALGNVDFLHEHLAGLRSRLAEYEGIAWSASPLPIDEITKKKVLKVAALFERGGTEGEQISAAHRIHSIAYRLGGWKFEDLLTACGFFQM